MHSPLFSIIIPSYNRAHIVGTAIESILSQSFFDYEIIVVDDGSVDDTENVLQKYTSDSRITYVKKNNTGVCDTRNTGASLAKGEYLLFLDSDDVLENDALINYRQVIVEDKADIVYGDMKVINSKTNQFFIKTGRNPYKGSTDVGVYIPGAFCLTKKLFDAAGGYDIQISYGENTELRFRIEAQIPSIAFVDKVVLIYESSADGGSKNLMNKIKSNSYMIKKHADYFKKNRHALRFFLQNVGVAYAKLGQWKNARKFLIKAYLLNLKEINTLVRFLICFFPPVAKKIWK